MHNDDDFQYAKGSFKGLSPDIFNLVEDRNRNPNLRPLRSSTNRPENLRLPAYQLNRNMRSFQASTLGLELWNKLPLELQNASTTNTFKNLLKSI